MKNVKLLSNILARTNNLLESGIACLQTVARYYGYTCSIDELKHVPKGAESGMTLLDLSKLAKKIGFSTKAYRADFETIVSIGSPLLLNIITKSGQNGYVVMFGLIEEKGINNFIIGDPLNGIDLLSQKQLEEIWVSQVCLMLEPTEKLELSDLAVKPQLVIRRLISERKLCCLVLCVSIIQILILTMSIILILRLFGRVLFFEDLTLASSSLVLGLLVMFIIYILLDRFRIYISKIYAFKMFGIFQYEYYDYLLGMSQVYFSNQNKVSLTAKGLNNMFQTMKSLEKVIEGIPYFVALPATLIALALRSWEILLVGISMFALLHIWYYRKRILLSHAFIALEGNVGASIATFIGFIENLDLYRSFKSASTILYNNTQWFVYPYLVQQKDVQKIYVLRTFTIFLTICLYFLIGSFNYLRIINFEVSRVDFLIDSSLFAGLYFIIYKCTDVIFLLHNSDHFFNELYYLRRQETAEVIDRDWFECLVISNFVLSNPSEKSNQIKRISFTVHKGEMIGVVCDNNFEKSKICKVLTREDVCEETRSLFINGKELSTISSLYWNNIITLVPQEPKIFRGSIIENITFYDSMYSSQKVKAFFEKFQLEYFFRNLPKGCHTVVNDGGAELSRSEKHIISFFRSIYTSAAIILVDNIFIDLDANLENYLIEILKNVTEDSSVILLSTNVDLINKYCNKKYLTEFI